MELKFVCISDVKETVKVYSPKGVKTAMRNRRYYGLSFCKKGKITYVQNGRPTVSDQTTAVLLPKGGNYTILRQEAGVFRVINFECDLPLGQSVTGFAVRDIDRLNELYDTMQARMAQGDRLAVLAALYQMLSLLIEETDAGPIADAKDYISRQIAQPDLTNERISRALGISTGCLDRRFLRYAGITPKQYIIQCRMEKAKRLLAEHRAPVGTICEQCGYGSVYSFSRAFKQYTGLSPTAYRQRLTKTVL